MAAADDATKECQHLRPGSTATSRLSVCGPPAIGPPHPSAFGKQPPKLTSDFIAWRRHHPYPRCVRMTGTTDADLLNLDRFVSAQEATYTRVLTELARGLKTSHWMWFIFPQVADLGSSEMSRRYAIGSIEEAQAYLAHPLLGARYRECVAVLQDLVGTTAKAVFGSVDAAKLRSSLTLFAEAAPGDPLFATALQRWFGGDKDKRTVDTLSAGMTVSG